MITCATAISDDDNIPAEEFVQVFGSSVGQEDVFSEAIAPIVSEVMEGFNCTVFAYGQTGTGWCS